MTVHQAAHHGALLARKYHDDFPAAVIANATVGGDRCHRGTVAGSLVAAETQQTTGSFNPDSYFQ